MIRSKRVAVVGAGISGLFSLKSLLEEDLEPVCFEKSSAIGGTWNYGDQAMYGTPSTMSTTALNHSKELGSVSNFPFPDEAPNFLRHQEVNAHLIRMAETFGLFKYIRFNMETIRVERTSDYEETGQWVVVVRNVETDVLTSDIYDCVMICTGHNTFPQMPEYLGMEEFRGKMLHSHDLKTAAEFSDQNVAVIGTGCSALDAAVAASNVARQVYLSMRTPSWILPRIAPNGFPVDWVVGTRFSASFQDILPIPWCSYLFRKIAVDKKFPHKLYGIKPKHPILCRDPIINDEIPCKLVSGSIILRKDVKRITEQGVIFDGDDEETKLDAIVFGTGYTWKFHFLEEGTIKVVEDRIDLYKCIWPPHLKHSTLALVGFFLPFGSGFPAAELQTRWIARVFGGKLSLPNRATMMRDIEKRYKENKKRYTPSEKISIRVDLIKYMDDIASKIGVKPNFLKMLLTDPILFKACVFGPCLPYQYRLVGIHRWTGARHAILTAKGRVKSGFNQYSHAKTSKRDIRSHTSAAFVEDDDIFPEKELSSSDVITHF